MGSSKETAKSRAIGLLKNHHLRCGGARVEVLAHLIEVHRPISAGELCHSLLPEQVNEATVYRTLNTLADAGIARSVATSRRTRLYEVHAEETCRQEHAHFICQGCGGIECMEGTPMPRLPPPLLPSGYRVEQQRFYLYGSCPGCEEVQP